MYMSASWSSSESIFLAHQSWKLMWAILIGGCPSSVRLFDRLSVYKLLHFRLPLQNHWVNFNQTWHTSSLGKGDSSCTNEGVNPSPRGDNSKRVKMHWKIVKIFFSWTSLPNSIKLLIKYPWVNGIQVC
jgi:hypothetical protein